MAHVQFFNPTGTPAPSLQGYSEGILLPVCIYIWGYANPSAKPCILLYSTSLDSRGPTFQVCQGLFRWHPFFLICQLHNSAWCQANLLRVLSSLSLMILKRTGPKTNPLVRLLGQFLYARSQRWKHRVMMDSCLSMASNNLQEIKGAGRNRKNFIFQTQRSLGHPETECQ